MPTLNEIMARMGYPETETGPYVTELRAYVAKKMDRGLVGMSGGTWGSDVAKMTLEERAKAHLAFLWAADNFSYKVERLDARIFVRRTDIETMKRRIVFRHWLIGPAIRDSIRKVYYSTKFWFAKKVLRKTNPYA